MISTGTTNGSKAATIEIEIRKATNPEKKYMAVVHKPNGRTKTVQFGAAGMSDYTKHKDPERKQIYLDRHRKMRTGKIMKQQAFMLNTFFGISQQ